MTTKKTHVSGTFAEVKVSGQVASRKEFRPESDSVSSQWRYIRLTYPNGVTLSLPASIEPSILVSYINLV